MANITISDLEKISGLAQQKINNLNNDNALLEAPLKELKDTINEIIGSLTENKENKENKEVLLNEEQSKDDQLVKTLSDLKKIEKQLKGNKAWAVLKTGAQFLFKFIQLLFKSKYSAFAWGGVLIAGAAGVGVCAVLGASALAAGFPLCALAIGVGALGLAGCALFSDKVGKFVKSCFSTVKSWFSKSSDQGKETEALSEKISEVVKGLKEIQNQISKETLPASSTARAVEPISESPQPIPQQPPQATANHNSSGHRLSLASDSDESESPAHASVSSFGHRS